MFLPGESQGRQSLVGCRLWGRTESDTTEATWQQQQQQQQDKWVSQVMQVVEDPLVNAGDLRDVGSIPLLGRFPAGGHGN